MQVRREEHRWPVVRRGMRDGVDLPAGACGCGITELREGRGAAVGTDSADELT